ncbi:MAG TPA: FMN-binding protein [Acidimicrobiia bacterium]|jgi:uncharacterized protein with FMN-binding domain|nr:FMN-binding protein [Acidimicrobiia bacterium]
MRRAVPALVITLVGLGALASFKSAPSAATKPVAAAIAPPRTTPPTTGAPPPGTVPPTGPSPTTTTGATRTVDGDPVDNPYGTVQVRVTLQGNTITTVTALQMPFDRERSQYISQQAEPYLRQEALQAQSAQIELVSGATYTSDSYAQSLQSALDKAHA